jgi:CcmD family protein
MTSEAYLFAANLAVWLGLAGYVALLAARAGRIEKRLAQLERLDERR